MGKFGFVDGREEKFFFVITMEKGGVELFLEADEELNHSFGIRSPVHVVADENEMILGLRIDEIDHVFQRIKAAVNVADGKSSHGGVNDLTQDRFRVKPGCQESSRGRWTGRWSAVFFADSTYRSPRFAVVMDTPNKG